PAQTWRPAPEYQCRDSHRSRREYPAPGAAPSPRAFARSPAASSWVRRSCFDEFRFVGRVGDGDDAIYEDAGRDDRLGVQLARVDDLGDLDDRDLARHRHRRAEVSRRFIIEDVAVGIG